MERPAQERQLDLLELAASVIQRKRLDPITRAETVSLLKLLLNECSTALAKTSEVADE
ncbi:MAG: hypothetical protein J2P54_10115 [Bradyrhizobiaceae bacterium]|nr:hypothetical protein [Bradyrhizobiaceae bacterium]